MGVALAGHGVDPSLAAFHGLILVAALATRRLWLLFRAVFEQSLKMVRASFERTPRGYTVRAGEGALDIEIRRVLRCVALITFRGKHRHRKVRLLQALVAKRFQGIVPPLRIRMG